MTEMETTGKCCPRCGKEFKSWTGKAKSRYGNVTVCDSCELQEIFETTGMGPKGALQFAVKPYDGPRYWEEQK